MNPPILIKQAQVIDPASRRNAVADIFVQNGRIVSKPPTLPSDTKVIIAKGMLLAPGFIDLHVHLREPGGEASETIDSGSRAAARGGFTTVVAMPNTKPPLDLPDRVAFVKSTADKIGWVRVIPSGCLTLGRQGTEPADLTGLARAGAGAFTDDGSTVSSDEVMRETMRTAAQLKKTVMDHAQDRAMEANGVMHEGACSKNWKLPGIPSIAEIKIVERDIQLSRETGCAMHIQHVSTKEAVEAIRQARREGLKVSGEATPHHLTLTDADIDPNDANYKMNPPLRSEADRKAIVQGICDGTLSALATDHAPHTRESKNLGFLKAPFGIVGLETAIGVTYTALVKTGLMNVDTWIHRWTVGPANILGLPTPRLNAGDPADAVLIDTQTGWVVRDQDFLSKSHNSPFVGRKLTGKAVLTIYGGKITWSDLTSRVDS